MASEMTLAREDLRDLLAIAVVASGCLPMRAPPFPPIDVHTDNARQVALDAWWLADLILAERDKRTE